MLNASANKKKYKERGEFQLYQLTRQDESLLVQYYAQQNIKIYQQNQVIGPIPANDQETTQSRATREIQEIQRSLLNSDDYVGYLYTSFPNKISSHVEAFVITRDHVIKPIVWAVSPSDALMPSRINNQISFCATDLSPFIRGRSFIIAQASMIGCTTLCFAYLKNYLKNNAAQLRDYTLIIPYLDANRKINYFHFPSPEVLCYSQSSLFNRCIVAMLSTKQKVKIIDDVTTLTINHLLNTVINFSEDQNAKNLAKVLLSKLSNFKKNWMGMYSLIEAKRQYMQINSHNEMLSYATHRKFYKAGLQECKQKKWYLDLQKSKHYSHQEYIALLTEIHSPRELGFFCRNIFEKNPNTELMMFLFAQYFKTIIRPREFNEFYMALTIEQQDACLEWMRKHTPVAIMKMPGVPINLEELFEWLNLLKIASEHVVEFLNARWDPAFIQELIADYLTIRPGEGGAKFFVDHLSDIKTTRNFIKTYFEDETASPIKELFSTAAFSITESVATEKITYAQTHSVWWRSNSAFHSPREINRTYCSIM